VSLKGIFLFFFVCVARFFFYSSPVFVLICFCPMSKQTLCARSCVLVFLGGVSVLYGEISSLYGLVQTGLDVVAQTRAQTRDLPVCMNDK